VAARRLTQEEVQRLTDLFRRYGSTGIPVGSPDRAWVESILASAQRGEIQLLPEEMQLISALLVTPQQRERFFEQDVPVLLAFLLPILGPLRSVPIVGPIINAILGLLSATVSRGGQKLLQFLIGVSGLSVVNSIFGVAPQLAEMLGKAVASGVRSAPPVWGRIVAQVASDLTGGAVTPEMIPRPGGGDPAFRAALGLARFIFDQFTGFIAPAGPLRPETGVENAVRYLSANMTLQMTAWYLGLVHEMTSLGISRALKDLPGQISWSMGLGWLSWLVFGAPFRAAIADPLEVHYNRTYQFARLSPAQIVDLRRSRRIDDSTFDDWMADHGIDHQRRWLLLEQAMADPTKAEAFEWLARGIVDESYVRAKLRRAGYREEDVERYIQAWRRSRTQDELEALAKTAERLYQKGEVDFSFLAQVWDRLGLSPEEAELRKLRLDLEGFEQKTLSKAEVLDAYRDQAIDATEARARLRRMGYQDPDIDLLLRREEKRLGPAQVVDAAIRGLIPREEAIRRLRDQGYSEADARLLLSLATRELSPGQVLDALTQGLIPFQEARARLLRLGFREEDADLMLAFSQKRLSPADIQAALLRGFMTREEAFTYLVQSGYSPSDAQIILQLRFRLLSVGEIIDGVLSGLVPYDQALIRLQQLGYSQEDATLILVTALRKRQPQA
jgi:hypothetical protein